MKLPLYTISCINQSKSFIFFYTYNILFESLKLKYIYYHIKLSIVLFMYLDKIIIYIKFNYMFQICFDILKRPVYKQI